MHAQMCICCLACFSFAIFMLVCTLAVCIMFCGTDNIDVDNYIMFMEIRYDNIATAIMRVIMLIINVIVILELILTVYYKH